MDAYGQAILDTIEKLSWSDRTLMQAACSGGIIASMLLGHLAATGPQDRIVGLGLLITALVACVADHLCRWQNRYRSTQLLGGKSRFVLSPGGHIAAIVNPPGNPKANYGVNTDNPPRCRRWRRRTYLFEI